MKSNFKVFLKGIIDVSPLMIPVVPFGLIFGVLAIDIGFTPIETMAMSLIIFGGASQIVLLQLFSGGASSLVIISSVGAVNSRHLLYGAVVSEHLSDLKLTWKKASTNPTESVAITRGDVQVKQEQSLEALGAYAEAAEQNGEYGVTRLLQIYDDLDAMQMDPVLRFGPNSMSALDGFSKSLTASAQAKYQALDKLEAAGLPFTNPENLDPSI